MHYNSLLSFNYSLFVLYSGSRFYLSDKYTLGCIKYNTITTSHTKWIFMSHSLHTTIGFNFFQRVQ